MGNRFDARLARIEAELERRYGTAHHIAVVRYPWDLPYGDRELWLREELLCACGAVSCKQMTIGLLSPAKAPSPEAWSTAAIAWERERAHRA